jgi:hypothetical protein
LTVVGALLPAAVLVVAGAEFVVVGSAAFEAHGIAATPKDLDLVPEPSARNLRILREGLRLLGLVGAPLPNILTADVHTVDTSFGPIDILVRRGHEEYDDLCRSATRRYVAGVPVSCAALTDVVRLRHRYKIDAT